MGYFGAVKTVVCPLIRMSPDSQAKSEFPEYSWAGLGWRFFQERLFCFLLYLFGIFNGPCVRLVLAPAKIVVLSLPGISHLLERSVTAILSRQKLHDSTSF
jgi:hypothetical protein